MQKLKDNLSRQGAHHPPRHDGRARIRPRHRDETFDTPKDKPALPMHGYHYMLRCMPTSPVLRYADDEIVIDNGTVIEIQDEGQKLVGKMAPNSLRLVDGFATGDLQEGHTRPHRARRKACLS